MKSDPCWCKGFQITTRKSSQGCKMENPQPTPTDIKYFKCTLCLPRHFTKVSNKNILRSNTKYINQDEYG